MTDRRVVGLLVVVLGLLTAVVVPNSIGRGIAGVAQPVPVPEPPSVGACVGREFDVTWNWDIDDSAAHQYPELGLVDCDRAHVGEVVSVIARPIPTKVTTTPDGGTSIDDKNSETCYYDAAPFLGLPDASGKTPPRSFGYWWLSVNAGAVPLAPSARQRAAGAQWLACATYLVNDREMSGGTLVPYHGSLRDAVSTGAERDYLGFCPAEIDWNLGASSNCTKPHRGEIFGFGSLTHDVARTTLVSSCAKLVAQVTKNVNLIRDGRLVVTVQATDNEGQTIQDATIRTESTVQCGVVGAGGLMMKGSLIAIGSDPIPWS